MNRRKFLQAFAATGMTSVLSHDVLAIPSRYPGESVVGGFPTPTLTNSDDRSTDSPRLCLVAIGGAGNAMVAPLVPKMPGIHRIVAIDTTPSSLSRTPADTRILIGGRGRKPVTASLAESLAEANTHEISEALVGAHMVIVVAGLGGSTGTGISPVLAEIAKNSGALVVAMAVFPFAWEGRRRREIAMAGLQALEQYSDVVFPFSYPALEESAKQEALLAHVLDQSRIAFRNLYWNIAGCFHEQGLVGIDFEDVRIVLGAKIAALGWGTAQGDSRAADAVNAAIHHPLLGCGKLKSAYGLQVSIRGARQALKCVEINRAMEIVKTVTAEDAHIIFSADYDESLSRRLEVSILATAPWCA